MRFITAAAVMLLSMGLQAQGLYQEGVHYSRLAQPVKTITPGKIEVTEAFSYGCGHCYNFEPLINKWAENAPEDVELVKLPVVWRPSMQAMARLYYVGEALKMSKETNNAVFSAVHQARKNVNDESVAADVFKGIGVDNEKFEKTYKSFGVSSKVQQAAARTRSMEIRGTPQMVIDGRYSVSATRDIGHAEMLKIVDYLVAKVRAEQPSKAAKAKKAVKEAVDKAVDDKPAKAVAEEMKSKVKEEAKAKMEKATGQ